MKNDLTYFFNSTLNLRTGNINAGNVDIYPTSRINKKFVLEIYYSKDSDFLYIESVFSFEFNKLIL